jgi:hypothetical protein
MYACPELAADNLQHAYIRCEQRLENVMTEKGTVQIVWEGFETV